MMLHPSIATGFLSAAIFYFRVQGSYLIRIAPPAA
jgi:hypothetical protein